MPSEIPFHTQHLGLLGSLPSLHQVEKCDTIVFLGTNYPYRQFLPKTGQARGIQIDLKPEQLGVRDRGEVRLLRPARRLQFALNTAKALLKGDPSELAVIVDSAEALGRAAAP